MSCPVSEILHLILQFKPTHITQLHFQALITIFQHAYFRLALDIRLHENKSWETLPKFPHPPEKIQKGIFSKLEQHP